MFDLGEVAVHLGQDVRATIDEDVITHIEDSHAMHDDPGDARDDDFVDAEGMNDNLDSDAMNNNPVDPHAIKNDPDDAKGDGDSLFDGAISIPVDNDLSR